VLTVEQLDDFDRTGIVRLPAVFGATEAARMLDVVWGELRNRYTVLRDDPATWNRHPPTGLKSTRRHRAFSPILGPPLRCALDDLFGAGVWREPKHLGQVLVTMPNARSWEVPHRLWHTDFDYRFPLGELAAVKVWALVDDVAPGGGGTPQLAGSHRLMTRFLASGAPSGLDFRRTRDAFLRSHPWLRALSTDSGGDRSRFFDVADVDGLPARVVELTGSAGDIYVTHPWVLHSVALNADRRPRLMRSFAVYRDADGPGAA